MAGAAALRTGEQWRSLLYRTERFGQLGFTNTMLVWAQCPDAIQVHDYAEWKRLGRQVIRGEQVSGFSADALGSPPCSTCCRRPGNHSPF